KHAPNPADARDQTLPKIGPTEAHCGWNPGESAPSALSTSCNALESYGIEMWSLESCEHWFCSVMFCTFGPAGKKALVNGVTTCSSRVSITRYLPPGTVGCLFRLVRNDDPESCCTQASHVIDSSTVSRPSTPRSARRLVSPPRLVPKFDGARPTSMLTFDAP